MKELMRDLKSFCCNKIYIISLAVVALCAYGYAITHHAIGMDDTVIPLYFEDGLAPYVGRWSLYVINKIFHIADFVPWMTELASVIILILSVTLWCVLWKRICEPKVKLPVWSYVFIAAVFISCPLISEIYVFYLHNGICLGYGVTAVAVLCLMNSLSVEGTRRYRWGSLIVASLMLTVALGFYESFALVYIMGAIMCFFLLRCLYGKKEDSAPLQANILPWIRNGLLTVLFSFAVRFVVLKLLELTYQAEQFGAYNVLYRSLFGDIFTVEGELQMVLKRFFVKYYVNAIVYLPITVLVIAIAFIGVYAVCYAVRKKDVLLPVCALALVILPVIMSLIEGLATRYRTAQYVPVICAFAVFLLLLELGKRKLPRWLPVCAYVLLGVLVYNQCADMNKWFYLDDLKYQDAREVMDRIAYDLEKDYDVTKPIVFQGGYEVPYEITEPAFVSYSSPQYRWICLLTDPIDTHLKEKFFSPIGFGFAESPLISVLQWGVTAFDGTSQQLIEFWDMHGHDSFRCVTDLDVIEEARQIREKADMPGYPQEGYIMECDDYIIVSFTDVE